MTRDDDGALAVSAGPLCITLASVDEVCARLVVPAENWLSSTELARLKSITARRRHRQFLAGRYFARSCLAHRFGGHWHQYELSAPDEGSPRVLACPVALPPADLYFSLSHSADWLMCAVAHFPVGVDIEDITTRQRDTDALGSMLHGPRERALIQSMMPSDRRDFFYACWTLKEAWIKRACAVSAPAMTDVVCLPCDEGDQVQALVMRSPTWVAAITPAADIQNLSMHGKLLSADVAVAAWRYVQP